MAIEEQIRDTKGARFGLQLVWTQIKIPEALARFTLLIGLALLLLTTIGHAFSLRRPDVRLPSKTKGPRLSFVTVGCLFFFSFLTHQKLSRTFLIQNLPPFHSPLLRLAIPLSPNERRKVIDGQLPELIDTLFSSKYTHHIQNRFLPRNLEGATRGLIRSQTT